MSVRVLATLTTLPGKGDELLALWPALAEQVRAEAANISYDLWRDTAAPDTFIVWELWESMEGLGEHGKADHMREFGMAARGFMAGRPVVQVLDAVG